MVALPNIGGALCKFQRVSRLGTVTARHSSSGRQPNFAALNRGRHLYSAGRPSHWALAHISSIASSLSVVVYVVGCFGFVPCLVAKWPNQLVEKPT